jgi:GNAT superfamily N-acetyltransferase
LDGARRFQDSASWVGSPLFGQPTLKISKGKEGEASIMAGRMKHNMERFIPIYQPEARGYLTDMLRQGSVFAVEHDNRPSIKSLIRFCGKSDIDEILTLQTQVYKSVPAKETFVLTTAEELDESLDADVCIGAFHYGKLIAFSLMVTDPCSARNLGWHLDYGQERCSRCVTYDTTFVDPAYQGYGLQKMFIKLKDRIATNMGAVEALATVSPNNIKSLRNLERNGFTTVAQKTMYGDFDRLIMRKQL